MSASDHSGVKFDAHQVAQQMLNANLVAGRVSEGPLRAQTSGGSGDAAMEPMENPLPTPFGRLPDDLTDRANAELFAAMYGGRFRYVAGNGWYVWEAGRWKLRGGEEQAIWATGDMAAQMPMSDPQGRFSRQEVIKHRRYSSSTSGVKAMLVQAKTSPALSLDAQVLDGDPHILCTPSGVVDLATGVLRPADPLRDFNSRCTRVAPEPVPTPRFFAFLTDTFGADADGKEMIEYLHLLLGYWAMTGPKSPPAGTRSGAGCG